MRLQFLAQRLAHFPSECGFSGRNCDERCRHFLRCPGACFVSSARSFSGFLITALAKIGLSHENQLGRSARLIASGKIVLAYLSIGEAEAGRFYWDETWTDGGAADPDAPAWLGPSNPDFEDNYKVRYWDVDWQAILMGTSEAYLDRILAQGFDGVYLDIVDAYYYWSEVNVERSRATARRDMMDLIEAIAV